MLRNLLNSPKLKKFTAYLPLLVLIGVMLLHLAVAARMNIFRYNNFDFGKFDLGNMSQMAWNTLNGRFMYMTDYFGANVPRWAMSHVDPILLLFLPVFVLIPHSLTLVFGQMFLVILSCFTLYKISLLFNSSKWIAAAIGISYLLFPALGYVNAWTGYHGVTAAIPFFLLAFYTLEYLYRTPSATKYYWYSFWFFCVATMAGKEQLALYTFFLGIYAALFRGMRKVGVALSVVSMVWFLLAFLVIIPAFAPLRVQSYERFAESLNIDTGLTRDVALENYFLSRYEAFGDSYFEIVLNAALEPDKTINVLFGGDKLTNLEETFSPVLYLPLFAPHIFIFAIPDLVINYLTTAGGIGTSEIYNHRISMIIPVIYLSLIFSVAYFNVYANKLLSYVYFKLKKANRPFTSNVPGLVLCSLLVFQGMYSSRQFNNPVFMWFSQAVEKRLAILPVFAKTDLDTAQSELELGDVLRVSRLDNKDRECANKVVNLIPEGASVSGPDYLGAHLSQRETYAIFPALYNQADYVIVDVFSRKILTILDVDLDLVKNVITHLLVSDNYSLHTSCGNLFVFAKGPVEKSELLPLQERFSYEGIYDLPLFLGVKIVDFKLPDAFIRSSRNEATIVYYKDDHKDSLDGYVLFLSFINNETGDVYQAANLPSFALQEPEEWQDERYYIEDLEVSIPQYVEPGEYKMFVGMSNYIRTRSIYLGDVTIN